MMYTVNTVYTTCVTQLHKFTCRKLDRNQLLFVVCDLTSHAVFNFIDPETRCIDVLH